MTIPGERTNGSLRVGILFFPVLKKSFNVNIFLTLNVYGIKYFNNHLSAEANALMGIKRRKRRS